MDPSIRVLYIDDDPSFAEQTASVLEGDDERMEVVTVSSAAAAIDLLDAEHTDFDCLLSEYALSGMTGLALLKLVRRGDTELPFILYTGKENENIASNTVSAGVTDYVQKGSPEHCSVLADRIATAVEDHSTDRTVDQPEQQLQALADKSNDALWMFAADWSELIFINDAVEPIFGLSPKQLYEAPDRFLDAFHPDDREKAARMAERLSGGESIDTEFRVNRTENYERWVWIQAEALFEGEETVDRIVGFARDITERKMRENTLHSLNKVAVDLNTLDSVEEICERSITASEELLQFDLSVIDIEEDGILSAMAISEDIAPENTASVPVTEGIAGKTYRTGESFLVDDLDAHPVAQPQGPFQSLISIPISSYGVFQAGAEEPDAFEETDLELAELLISHTISALDRLDREQRLHHQNEQLEEFNRIVSHDLRNPMNVIDGSLELARKEHESGHLQTASEALARMEDIVEDTLTLAREGHTVGEMKEVRLDVVATNCWGNLATESATLDVATKESIRADPNRVRHIFENIFRNAMEHAGTDVTVRVGGLDDGFYIEDDGSGIAEADRDQIFEPGYSTASTSGFGLAIVRQVAEAHGWQVRITEGTEGGARFEFTGVEVLD